MIRACVIGWPISHSRSPLIHGYWLAKHRIEGSYTRQPVEPGALGAFITGLPASGLAGCNVTIPHKEAAFRLVEPADELTERLGVVNTIFLEHGRLRGLSTDGAGYMAHLKATQPQLELASTPALVLGAGGASQAIIASLIDAGCPEILLTNRTPDRANLLAMRLGPRIRTIGWEARNAAMADTGLLVNTTSLGMTGQEPLDVDLSALPPGSVVSDIVYAPLETPLLRLARARGLPTVDGLGMLLHQAVPGFEKWFGLRPAVTPDLYRLIAADIEQAASR
jgi:shikimate dehydrogenase